MKTTLMGIGLGALAYASYQLYLRQTKKAKDENIADVILFGAIGVGALLMSKKN